MPRVVNRLTAVRVNSLRAAGLYADGHGLYLRVRSGGSKSWIYRYRANGKLRDMGLGPLSTVSLMAARALAAEHRRTHHEGRDPIALRKELRITEKSKVGDVPTFRECADQVIASHQAGWRNNKHRQQWANTLATYVHPIVGDVPICDIGVELVLKVLRQPVTVSSGKKAPLWNAKSETSSRVRGRMEAVLSFAKARGFRAGENPATWRGHLDALLPAPAKVRRVKHHAALPYKEMSHFFVSLAKRTGASARALEFAILTAARTSEVLGAKFTEFDLKSGLWTVPPERMKAGKEHRVPLSNRAVMIVSEMKKISYGEYVFPGLMLGKPLSSMALLMLVRDLRTGITTHGFRSTFRDWAAEETNTANHIVEMALAHNVEDKVEAAYRRGDLLEKRRKLMNSWASYCTSKIT